MAMNRAHKKLLDEFHFEHCGQVGTFLKKDEFDGSRVIYAVTNPEKHIHYGTLDRLAKDC